MMKGPIGYKLSPNEEAKLLKETREALRKQRLLQVGFLNGNNQCLLCVSVYIFCFVEV